MNKKVFAFCMAALLLTGCGSTAPAAENSTPAAESVSQAESAAEKESEKAENIPEDEEIVYDTNRKGGVDIPRLKRLYYALTGESGIYVNNMTINPDCVDLDSLVFYEIGGEFSATEFADYWGKPVTTESLFERRIDQMEYRLSRIYGHSIGNDLSKFTFEKEEEEEILGFKAIRSTGTIRIKKDDNAERTIHFIHHLAFINNDMVTDWMSFTSSDNQEQLDEMQYLADLPLTKAKLHEAT